jgi:large conductance mechanosensitive channel
MGLLQEFKEFAMRGNVVDLAVGVVIGAAFKGIVDALVGKIALPIVGALTAGVDFSEYTVKLPIPNGDPVELGVGILVTSLINFLIVALTIFIVVKAMNTAQKRLKLEAPAPAPAPPSDEVVLLREIRDALKAR